MSHFLSFVCGKSRSLSPLSLSTRYREEQRPDHHSKASIITTSFIAHNFNLWPKSTCHSLTGLSSHLSSKINFVALSSLVLVETYPPSQQPPPPPHHQGQQASHVVASSNPASSEPKPEFPPRHASSTSESESPLRLTPIHLPPARPPRPADEAGQKQCQMLQKNARNRLNRERERLERQQRALLHGTIPGVGQIHSTMRGQTTNQAIRERRTRIIDRHWLLLARRQVDREEQDWKTGPPQTRGLLALQFYCGACVDRREANKASIYF